MINAKKPQIASKGDVLQHALQALGMSQKGAAHMGAMKDLSCGDLAGYHKNMFEAATGFDPGRLAGAALASPFGCCKPGINLARLLGQKVPTGKLRARRSYHTPFGTVQVDRRDLGGKGFFGKLKGRALEARLSRDPIFRAKFEAQVGGKYVPDGRNDGKVTVRRFKPNIFGRPCGGHHGIGARTVLGGLAQMQKQIADLVGKLGNKGNAEGGIQGKEGSYVSKLPKNATFEDLVAAFMKDVMKEQQKEVKAKMAEMNKLKDDHKASEKSGSSPKSAVGQIMNQAAPIVGGAIGSILGGPLGAMLGSNILGGLSKAATSSASSNSSSSDGKLSDTQKEANDDYQDSRQMMMEELKNMMQNLQQMQQALSNVLNTMHQGAMNSIRNIRA
jgi:hypothetical protein